MAEEIAKAAGFSICTKARTSTARDGTTATVYEPEYSTRDNRHEWADVYFKLEPMAQAVRNATKGAGLLTSHAEYCMAVELEYKGGRDNACELDDDDLPPFEARESSTGWTIDDGDGYHFCEPAENTKESAEARAGILTQVRDRMQSDAIEVQAEINALERDNRESVEQDDSDCATFTAWKKRNGIESDFEIWDVRIDGPTGEAPDVYEVCDGLCVRLELENQTREVAYLSAK